MSIEDIRLVRVNNDNGDAPSEPLAATNDEEDDSTERCAEYLQYNCVHPYPGTVPLRHLTDCVI